jgi:hypothetical protein
MMNVLNRKQFAGLIFFLVVFALISNTMAADTSTDNTELKQIYDADQNDREAPFGKLDWQKINPRDAARRKRVRDLMEQGRLSTGKDYERAAMVFQHGEGTDDILMAHVLAVTAIGKGDTDARWLAAATLDRYLTRIGQPQVFGTQFNSKTEGGQTTWTMEPYNRTLIEPNLRDANCVPDQTHQAETLQAISKGREPQPPTKRPCAESPKH